MSLIVDTCKISGPHWSEMGKVEVGIPHAAGVESRRSIQSVNVHLVGLYLVLERGVPGDFARRIIGVVAQKLSHQHRWLAPPLSSGD